MEQKENSRLNRPLVSVIMNCLNGERYVREALDSAFSQTYKDWEIIFWDNASTDGSSDIAKSYGKKVRLFRSAIKDSLGAARNKAFSKCKGEYIAFLDVDDLWLSEKLERQVSLFEKDPKLGMVFCDSIFFDDRGDQYRLFQRSIPKRGKVLGELLAKNFVCTAATMHRKNILDALPYVFDDEFTTMTDYELAVRIAYLYEVDYVDSPLTKIRKHSDNESDKKQHLTPGESQIFIDRLCNEYPNIKSQYKKEVSRYIASIYLKSAFQRWRQGDRSGARKALIPCLKLPKAMTVYLCTWVMPYNFFESLKVSTIYKLLPYLRR